MKTIALLSQKGGAGKTTLSLNLAVALQRAGLTVGVIDIDPQQTSATWGDIRGEAPDVHGAQYKQLPKIMQAARDAEADILIIDTPPGKDAVHLEVARISDLILVPCRPSVPDVKAIMDTLKIVEMAGKTGFTVWNAALPTSPSLVREAREALQSWGHEPLGVVIHQRVVFQTSFGAGRAAIEIEPDGKAADEVRTLVAWITKQLNLQTVKPQIREAA